MTWSRASEHDVLPVFNAAEIQQGLYHKEQALPAIEADLCCASWAGTGLARPESAGPSVWRPSGERSHKEALWLQGGLFKLPFTPSPLLGRVLALW